MSEATPENAPASTNAPVATAENSQESTPEKPPLWTQQGCLILLIIGGGLLLLECAGLPLLSLLVGFAGIVTLGWAWFLYKTLPQVSVSWGDVVLGLLLLGLILGTAHWLAVWFARQRRKLDPPLTTSLCGTVLVVLMFAAGTTMVAGVHQIAWLAMAEQPFFSPSGIRGAARRAQSRHNLKQIGLAMHIFHDSEGEFPAGGTVDEWGAAQHSWVTQLLPFLDHVALYEEIDHRRPWTDERNRAVFERRLHTIENPGLRSDERLSDGLAPAHYAANARVHGLGRRMRLYEISKADGSSYTIFAGEISTGIPAWGDPFNFRDPARGVNGEPGAFGSPWRSGTHVLMGDGRVVSVNHDIDPRVLKALSTPDGGEPPSDDWDDW